MNYKKKSILLSILIILSIQILLLINNRQKTSFRYFIWNFEDVSIGRLICISFISGLLISSLLNKTLDNDDRTVQINEENTNATTNDDNSSNRKDSDSYNEMPPERDLRDTQPTISVNYRVIKDNFENELKDRKQRFQKSNYDDVLKFLEYKTTRNHQKSLFSL